MAMACCVTSLCFIILVSLLCTFVSALDEGDDCFFQDTKENGVCTQIRDCPPVYMDLKRGIVPKKICKFIGTVAVVCCTDPSPQPPPLLRNNRVVCYFSSWSVYRPAGGTFDVEDIDPTLCTHLVYAFAGITEEAGIKVINPWNALSDNYGKDAYKRFINLKKRAPWVKILIAIGGWEEGSENFSNAFKNATGRQTFVRNVVNFIKLHGFDGIDLDWEYPAERGGKDIDKLSYIQILQELREKFDKHGYLLSIIVSPLEIYLQKSYKVDEITRYVDFINLKSYDYNGAWENKTGHNAPLFKTNAEKGTVKETFNIDSNVKAWLSRGAVASKLVIAIATFGRTFTLASSECTESGCGIKGQGNSGNFTKVAGFLGYNEICSMEAQSIVKFDEEARVPYIINGDQWVSYDNLKSVQDKVDYITDNNLGGAWIWSVDTDDFNGNCGKNKFPLLNTVNARLKKTAKFT